MNAKLEISQEEIKEAIKNYCALHGWTANKVDLQIKPGYQAQREYAPPSVTALCSVTGEKP